MSWKEDVGFIIGSIVFSIGIGMQYGIGMALSSFGMLFIFVATMGEWE